MQYVAMKIFIWSSMLRYKAINVGDVANYVSWLRERFGDFKPLATRERLWERMAQVVGREPVRGIELGVAYGYGTGWWLNRLSDSRLRWDGFDRFTGLPRAWRNLGMGTFTSHGQTPAIDDLRLTWHIGDVEDQIEVLDLNRDVPFQLIVLFDLDIYEPTAVAWQHLRDHLRPGDVLYFDEAFDSDERRILNDLVLPAGEYAFIGATSMALALSVRKIFLR